MGRPYVIVNVAASVDGKIDTFERRGAAISSARDRERVDALRASVDAVMVGGHTLVAEDPRLTVKSAELRAERVARGVDANPAKVGVVSSLERLNPGGRFVASGPARVIVFTPASASDSVGTTRRSDPAAALREKGVQIFAVGDQRVDLLAAMATLHDVGIRRVLVEGGGTLNFELFRLGLVDELQMFMGPVIFGGAAAPTLADGTGLLRDAAIKLMQTSIEADADGGVLLRYKVERRE